MLNSKKVQIHTLLGETWSEKPRLFGRDETKFLDQFNYTEIYSNVYLSCFVPEILFWAKTWFKK